MASIIISPSSEGYSIYVTVGKHSRTYTSPTVEAAQARAERLCFMLDLRTDIIRHGSPDNKKVQGTKGRSITQGKIPFSRTK